MTRAGLKTCVLVLAVAGCAPDPTPVIAVDVSTVGTSGGDSQTASVDIRAYDEHGVAVQLDPAAASPGEETKQRRFSGSVRAQQTEHFVAPDIEREPIEAHRAVRVSEANVEGPSQPLVPVGPRPGHPLGLRPRSRWIRG